MQSYFFEWDSRLQMNSYLLLYGGVQNLMTQKIHEIANQREIKIAQLTVGDIGISILASSDPSALIRAAERNLRFVQVAFRVDYPLLKLTKNNGIQAPSF